MKKYILLSAMSLLCISSFANKVQTGVKFGDKTNGCGKGSGICYIGSPTSSSEAMTVDMELNTEGTVLTMSIPETGIDQLPDGMYDGFMNGYFSMNDPFTIPADAVSALQSMSDITVQKGQYPVAHVGRYYVVTFRL